MDGEDEANQSYKLTKAITVNGNSNYSLIEEYLENTSLVVNNEEIGQKLVNYIKTKEAVERLKKLL